MSGGWAISMMRVKESLVCLAVKKKNVCDVTANKNWGSFMRALF